MLSVGVLALSLAGAPQGALPFEELGARLLRAADELSAAQPARGADLLARLAPLHSRVDLGVLEVWIPTQALDAQRQIGSGPRWKEARPSVECALAITGEWSQRARLEEQDGANVAAALAQLKTWAKSVRSVPVEDSAEARAAREAFARALLGPQPAPPLARPTLLLAPTRTHFVGVIGASGLVDEGARAWNWVDLAAVAGYWRVTHTVTVFPLTSGNSLESGAPLEDFGQGDALVRQWNAHALSHLLSASLVPTSTHWLHEALAIHDTVRTTAFDDTLCRGFSSKTSPLDPASAALLNLLTRDLSPFRGGASKQFFVRELRAMHTREGFLLRDLDKDRDALRVAPPFLAAKVKLPPELERAGDGVKKGYAEFFRAYSAAFVHWLDSRKDGDGSQLDLWLRELHRRAASGKPQDFNALVREKTGKTLGASADPAADLEGEFLAWLGK